MALLNRQLNLGFKFIRSQQPGVRGPNEVEQRPESLVWMLRNWDDKDYLINNPLITSLSFLNIQKIFSTPSSWRQRIKISAPDSISTTTFLCLTGTATPRQGRARGRAFSANLARPSTLAPATAPSRSSVETTRSPRIVEKMPSIP